MRRNPLRKPIKSKVVRMNWSHSEETDKDCHVAIVLCQLKTFYLYNLGTKIS